MHFEYDPILGLQYSFNDAVLLNLNMVPDFKNTEQFLEEWKKHLYNQGVVIIDSSKEEESVITPIITSNINL